MNQSQCLSRRVRSLELMRALQPLTQTGVLSASEGQNVIVSWKSGDDEPLKALIYSPSVPVYLTPVLKKLEDFIAQ